MGLLHYYKENQVEAGCDEAGRGCLAGPAVAAAVILPVGFYHPLLNDSKKMTEKHRNELRGIIERDSIAWGVGIVDHLEIDKINILNASFEAMHRAVKKLKTTPEFLLIDGNRFNPYPKIDHACIIKGDGKYLSIAAASVLAKTHRDELMEKYDAKYPQYGWKKNKGYPTLNHRRAIYKVGPSPIHRMSFRLLPENQLSLFE